MTAPVINPLPALPTFPSGPGLPDQPGVFIPQFLTFLNSLGTFGEQANALAAYLDGLGGSSGGGGATSSSAFVTPQQFGAVGDGATDDSAAFVAALAYLKSISQIPYPGWIARGAPKLFIPLATYLLSTTTLDVDFTLIIEGEGTIVGYGSRLKWTGDCTGIRIQASNTDGASGATGSGTTGSYTTIRNLGLFGPYEDTTDFTGFTEGEYHGVHARSNYIIEDCHIEGFAGDGLHVLTSSGAGGAEEGNSNCSFVNRLAVKSVRNGVFIDGADGNAGTFIGVVGTYCRQHTVWDSSFLGNLHIGPHSANAGLVPGVPPCIVSASGNRYFVIQGQATWCKTNAPSGTAFDNQGWAYMGAGGVSSGLNIAAWVSGTTYREGGGYRTDSLNAANLFINAYQEGGEAVSQFFNPTLVIGGLTGGVRDPLTAGNLILGGKMVCPSPTGANNFGLTTIANTTNTLPHLKIHNSGLLAAGAFARTDYCQGFEADGVTPLGVARIQVWPSTSSAATAEGIIYFGTRTFGGGGTFTDILEINGATGSTPHLAPLTDNAMDSGVTTKRWKNGFFYTLDAKSGITSSSATAGIGYATGAGGAVTQATSKSTGVTLNKVCGQITMNAAALASATGVSFTVTNSAVAATDTIDLVLASGNATAGTYNYQIDKVSAGSFVIWVKNISGGSLSEALVFNFSVKKAVAA